MISFCQRWTCLNFQSNLAVGPLLRCKAGVFFNVDEVFFNVDDPLSSV